MFTVIVLAGLAWMTVATIFVLSLFVAARRKTIPDSVTSLTEEFLSDVEVTQDVMVSTAPSDASSLEVTTPPLPA